MYEIVFEPSDLNMLAAIGIIEKAKLFPYLLSMGDLRHPCDSCYRCEQFIKCLSEYCTDCKSQAKKLWEKYHTTEDIIQDAMMNQKSLRIWVSLDVFVQSDQILQVPGAAWSLCCLRNTMPS